MSIPRIGASGDREGRLAELPQYLANPQGLPQIAYSRFRARQTPADWSPAAAAATIAATSFQVLENGVVAAIAGAVVEVFACMVMVRFSHPDRATP